MYRAFYTYPARHLMGVRLSVVIVEDHDGGDDGACHHEHDAVKIRPWEYNSIRSPAHPPTLCRNIAVAVYTFS